jgi:hypothetical protein
MRRITTFVFWFIIMIIMSGCQSKIVKGPEELSVTSLRCEYRTDPVGIDVAQRSIIWANFGEADMRLRHGGEQARIDKITYLIIYQ